MPMTRKKTGVSTSGFTNIAGEFIRRSFSGSWSKKPGQKKMQAGRSRQAISGYGRTSGEGGRSAAADEHQSFLQIETEDVERLYYSRAVMYRVFFFWLHITTLPT